ncbi:type II secretion system F family protein [Rubritalea marina]|uniref:type II secretion system F family protein n=1 Tax=Rubritalea marina TaxID=361055 RepID=UPI000382431E|nr:type II secretion system F family protein [Rubritalea marina]
MSQSFQYVALDSRGKQSNGSLVAQNRVQATQMLKAQKLRVLSLKQGTAGAKASKRGSLLASARRQTGKKELSQKDVVLFTEELSELLESGLPLEPALASMEGRSETGVLQQAASKLRKHITEGEHMYQALPKVSSTFGALYCNLVKAGEAGGGLQTILSHHAGYLSEQMELRARLKQAMIYPAVLLVFCLMVGLVFIFYLIPQLLGLLESLPGSEIPLGVVIAVSLKSILTEYWMYIIVAIVALITIVKLWHDREENKLSWDRLRLQIPILGAVSSYGIYVQWLQTLSNLLSNGLPLVQALKLTQETVTNRFLRQHLVTIHEGVSDGYRFTSCLSKAGVFPPNLVDLIAVGEKTGNLSKAVERAAIYYDKRLSAIIQSAMSLITPVILIVMAGLVGMLSYTFIQAIYETMSNMR